MDADGAHQHDHGESQHDGDKAGHFVQVDGEGMKAAQAGILALGLQYHLEL